ncbi:MAG: hypothetical protein ACREAZ_09605 [Nitrososphaera sp.]
MIVDIPVELAFNGTRNHAQFRSRKVREDCKHGSTGNIHHEVGI